MYSQFMMHGQKNIKYQMMFLHTFGASISIENVPFTVEDTATNQTRACKEIKCI